VGEHRSRGGGQLQEERSPPRRLTPRYANLTQKILDPKRKRRNTLKATLLRARHHKGTNRGEIITATDTLSGSIDFNGTVEGIRADRESPTGGILCPKEETTTGVLHIDATFTGYNAAGNPATVSLSHL
jgi:hypothetical protein